MKKIPLMLALLTLLCCVPEARAAAEGSAQVVPDDGNALATADANGGYSGQVLAMISRVWTPPPDTINRRVAVRLKIDGEGNLTQCDLMTRSDMPEMNRAACFAAKEAGNFGVPPYGMPIDVYVTFWTGKPTKNTRGGKPVEDADKPAAANPGPKPEPKGVVVKPEAASTVVKPEPKGVPVKPEATPPAPKTEPKGVIVKPETAGTTVKQDTKPEPKGVVVKPEAASSKPEPKGVVVKPEAASAAAKPEPKAEPKGVPVKPEATATKQPKPEPKGVPVLPAKVEPAKVESAKPSAPAPAKADTPARPEAKSAAQAPPAAKPAAKPASRGGLAGDSDAATTPIKSSSSKAASDKGATAKTEAPKKEAPKKEAPSKETPKKDVPRKESGKKDTTKAEKPGIRTDFAPYRDPKAKPEAEKPVTPSAEQRRYAAEVTALVQARLVPPSKLPSGKYTVAVTVGVGGAGDVSEAEISRSSGQPVLDEAVLRSVLRMEKVTPPPDKQGRDVKLTLTVHKP